MAITLNGDSGITTPTYGGTVTAEYSVPVTAFKNRIINGQMMIDQRNAGASVTPTNGQYLTDRFYGSNSQASKFSAQQSSTAPAGFVNSLLITSLSSYSITSGDYFVVTQRIEGYNIADLGFGSANAQTVTLSFWVRSSLTGTFGGALQNSGNVRSYPFTYTISSANTWEQKTITVAGDTSGTWLTTNGVGLQVVFGLGVGSTYSGTAGSWATANYVSATGATSVVGTNGATFYITGVQLEKGSTATSFDYRPYGTELALCQRYYWKANGSQGANTAILVGGTTSTTSPAVRRAMILNPVTMRATPTPNYSGSGIKYGTGNGTYYAVTALAYNSSSTMFLSIDVNGGTSITAGQLAHVIIDSTSASDWFEASSEL